MDISVANVSGLSKKIRWKSLTTWAGSFLFAPQTPSSLFPALLGWLEVTCVDQINGLLAMWFPVCSGNAGWKVESEIRVYFYLFIYLIVFLNDFYFFHYSWFPVFCQFSTV